MDLDDLTVPEYDTMAPKLVSVTKPIEEKGTVITMNYDKDYSPKVNIIACGGFGINQIKDLPKFLNYRNASFKIIDTSKANIHRQEIDPCIDIFYVGEEGHAKIRGTNLSYIQKKMDEFVYNDENEADITILIFSLPGGSGSVVGPLLIHPLAKKEKPIIVITVADASSTVDCENSIKSIKSIESQAKNSYVNMILFDNSITGRNNVDSAIKEKISLIINGINLNNIGELDKSDISVAMRPYQHKILSAVRGLYVMKVGDGCDLCYDNEEITSCHSCIKIEGSRQVEDKVHNTIHYGGKWVHDQNPIVMRFGLPIPDTFLKKYDALIKKSQAASSAHNNQSSINVAGAEEHDSGLII